MILFRPSADNPLLVAHKSAWLQQMVVTVAGISPISLFAPGLFFCVPLRFFALV
jgi:hypothetical protein